MLAFILFCVCAILIWTCHIVCVVLPFTVLTQFKMLIQIFEITFTHKHSNCRKENILNKNPFSPYLKRKDSCKFIKIEYNIQEDKNNKLTFNYRI